MLNNDVLCMCVSEGIRFLFLVVYSFPSPITGDLQSPPPAAKLIQHNMNIFSFTWLHYIICIEASHWLVARGNIHSNQYILISRVALLLCQLISTEQSRWSNIVIGTFVMMQAMITPLFSRKWFIGFLWESFGNLK